jgi:DNA-binding NtrC family response regulator
VTILKYAPATEADHDAPIERRVDQLVMLAKALASEIETLKAELTPDQNHGQQFTTENDGIDFYDEVERYEIELIRTALNHCGGNQSQAAKLLHLKSTTLNAKMKHYGLNPVRSIMLQRQNSSQK